MSLTWGYNESVSVAIGPRRALLWSTLVVSSQRSSLGVVRREGEAGFADSGAAAAGVIEHLARSGEHPFLSRTDPEGSVPLGQLPDYRVDLASVTGAKPLKILLVPAAPVGWAQLRI